MTGTLALWTIYKHPKDVPHEYVARRHEIVGGDGRPTNDLRIASLSELRAQFEREGLVRLERWPNDDPCIVETWI